MAIEGSFLLFMLVFMRMSGFILLNPIYGRRNIPIIAKIMIIFSLSIIITIYYGNEVVITNDLLEITGLLLKEFTISYIIGFIITLFVYVIIFGGELIDMQMGLSMSKIYDPQNNTSLSVNASFYNAMFIILFFVTDGHLTLINLFLNSHRVLPFGNFIISKDFVKNMIDIFTLCTILAIKLSFPLLAIEFLSEIGVGIIIKSIPQVNVFVINLQMRVFIGLIMLLIMFQPSAHYIVKLIETMLQQMGQMLRLIGG